jgi:Arc/MetJ family transcription regulator
MQSRRVRVWELRTSVERRTFLAKEKEQVHDATCSELIRGARNLHNQARAHYSHARQDKCLTCTREAREQFTRIGA